MEVIAVITARANSKGIPKKNLRTVGGVSLIGRSVLAAKESGIFTKIVVTTDGEEIAKEAKHFGAQIVMRPADLSGDDAKSIFAVQHCLNTLGILKGISILLQPTSPLRTAEHIKSAYLKYLQNPEGSLISINECEHHPYKTFFLDNASLLPVFDSSYLESPRQILPKVFRINGAIYINKIEDIMSHETFFIQPIKGYEMSLACSIDIDSDLDLKISNLICGGLNE